MQSLGWPTTIHLYSAWTTAKTEDAALGDGGEDLGYREVRVQVVQQLCLAGGHGGCHLGEESRDGEYSTAQADGSSTSSYPRQSQSCAPLPHVSPHRS